ncbi:MAG: T9SS type A sorting domain-containing protein [Candidatus Eisenbacteria bacterium]
MSRVFGAAVFAVSVIAVLGCAGMCLAEVVLYPPDVQVREGDRTVVITWTDPDPEALVSINQPVTGSVQFPWDGNATLTSQGFYTGACDWTFNILVNWTVNAMELAWDEIADWEAMTLTSRRIEVTETDQFYELSEGIRISVDSEGLFDAKTEGWSGPMPDFRGIYTGEFPVDPGQAVQFTFHCTTGGELSAGGGTSITFEWDNGIGGSGSFTVGTPDVSIHVDRQFKVGFPVGTYVAGESFSVDVWVPLADGDRIAVRAETFDGYLVLRHSVEDTPPHEPTDSIRSFKVIAEISKCDSFALFSDSLGVPAPYATRTFTDRGITGDGIFVNDNPDFTTVFNGFPYNYAVVTYDWSSQHHQAMSKVVWSKVFPAVSPASDARRVRVVPNPYVGRAGWEMGGDSKIQFVNIPDGAKIRIYDAAGGYINTVRPNQFSYEGGGSQGTADWNLVDSDGKQVVSGIYLYRIESKSGNELGRFIIVR